jgi:uncharacterized protein
MSFEFIAFLTCCLCGISFIAVLLRAVWVLVLDACQNARRLHEQQDQQDAHSIEIASKLRQTKTNLSMSRRVVVWREVLVAKIVQESKDVRSYYLIDVDHEPLPCSQPGQHILVERPPIQEVSKEFRCYSLSDDCSAGYWRISVKKNSNHRQSVSRWFHEDIQIGDRLRVRGPSGAFYLRSELNRSIVFASAGIGLTPMLPMLIEATRRNTSSIRMFVQYRDVDHMPFADSLLSIAKKHPQVQLQIWISRFPSGVRSGVESQIFEGKFQSNQLLKSSETKTNTDFYLCGPEAWQTRLTSDLVDGGVARNQIEYELFQQTESLPVAKPDGTFPKILFKQSGAVATFEETHPSVLGCASKNQVEMESGCRTGACGSCVVKLLQGSVRYTRQPQFPIKANEILPCVCVPESDLVVDA